jgi:hypothetical protein
VLHMLVVCCVAELLQLLHLAARHATQQLAVLGHARTCAARGCDAPYPFWLDSVCAWHVTLHVLCFGNTEFRPPAYSVPYCHTLCLA